MDTNSAFAGPILAGLLSGFAALASAATPGPTPAAAPPPAVASLTQPSAPVLPAGQVWECTLKGQKAFSDKPCGEHASIRQLSVINTMEATPLSPPLRVYASNSMYAPAYAPEYAPQYAPDDDYSGTPEPQAAYYGVVQRNPSYDRARHGRNPRRHASGSVKK